MHISPPLNEAAELPSKVLAASGRQFGSKLLELGPDCGQILGNSASIRADVCRLHPRFGRRSLISMTCKLDKHAEVPEPGKLIKPGEFVELGLRIFLEFLESAHGFGEVSSGLHGLACLSKKITNKAQTVRRREG